MGVKIKSTEKNQGVNTKKISNEAHTSGRLDLNDLLKRAKEEQNNNKKNNLLIISGAIAVAAVFFLIFSL